MSMRTSRRDSVAEEILKAVVKKCPLSFAMELPELACESAETLWGQRVSRKHFKYRTYSESWSYHIIGERLIAYKYGKTSEVQVQNIEKSLNTIIEQFEEMKKDLVFLLSENEDQQN